VDWNNDDKKESWSNFEFRLQELEGFVKKARSLCAEPHLISQDVVRCLNNVISSFDGGEGVESASLAESISRSCDQLRVIQEHESVLETKYKNQFDKRSRGINYYKGLSGSLCEQMNLVSAKEEIEEFIKSNPQMRSSSVSTINDFYNALFNAEEPSRWSEEVLRVGEVTSNNLVTFLSIHAQNSIELFLLRCDFSTRVWAFEKRTGGPDKDAGLFDLKLCLNVDGMELNINVKLRNEYFNELTPMVEFSGEFISKNDITIKERNFSVRQEQKKYDSYDLVDDIIF
jgi:hypothetical protein